MADDKAQQEPSMEDILASIRRILSEDEAEEKPKAPPPPAPEPEPAPPPPAASSPQDDIDALFAAPPPMREPEPEPPEIEDDVLELTEDMVLEEPEPMPAFNIDDFKSDVGFDEPEPEPQPVVMAAARVSRDLDDEPRYRPPPPPRMEDDDEPLMSRPVEQRSTSLLSDLAREIVRQRSIGLGNGGVTLEDMVRELLRPVLKEWLDENLPYMIERIVKKEIEKMVNRAEDY